MQEVCTFKVSGTACPTAQCHITEDRMLLWCKSQLQITVMWDMILHWLAVCYRCIGAACCCNVQGSSRRMIAWTQCFENLQSWQSYCAQTVTLLSVCTKLSLLLGSRMKKR
jgi:hypothetical protein